MTTSNKLLNAARQACTELKRHIAGDLILSDTDLNAARVLVREASKTSLFFFAKYVLGFNRLTRQTHKRWADDLQSKFLTHHYLMRLKPRGTYKTTLYGEAFALWVWATFSPKVRIFYTSASQPLLDEVSAHLGNFLGFETSSLYHFVFGIKRDKTAQQNTTDVFNIVGRDAETKGSSLIFRPAGGSTNGVHPHLIIIDDACDKEDRESNAVRESKKRWFDSLHGLLIPFEVDGLPVLKMIIDIGTRWHLADMHAHIIEKNSETSKPEDRFDIEIEGVYKKDGSLNYPEFFTEEMIAEKKGKTSSVFFACQWLNDPLPEGARVFEESRLHFVRPDQIDIRQGTNLCFFDPSQGKSGSDFPAVWWCNLYNSRKVFFRAIDQRIELTAMVGLIAQYNKQDGVREMVFENNGTMDLLEEKLVEAHRDIKWPIMITAIHETRNKNERITAMQPELYNGSVFFLSDWRQRYPEALSQIIFYPAWGHDDYPDCAEKALTHISRNIAGEFVTASTGKTGHPGKATTFAGSLNKNSSRSMSW